MSATRPSLDYLATCSEMSLESVELSRLNIAANLRKEFREILEEWIDTEVDARLARTLLEWRRAHDAVATYRSYSADAPARFEQLAIAFLPEPVAIVANSQPERDADASLKPALATPAAPCERAQLTSAIRKPDQEHAAPLTSPCSRSTSLTKAAAVYLGAGEKLVERLAPRSRARAKTSSVETGGNEFVPDAGSSNPSQRSLVTIAPPAPAVASQTLTFVPLRATGGNSTPLANASDKGMPTPELRMGLRLAPPARAPFRGGPARQGRAAAAL